jgi:hypothetical protein
MKKNVKLMTFMNAADMSRGHVGSEFYLVAFAYKIFLAAFFLSLIHPKWEWK